MIPINNLKQTCSMCPSQWEFTTFENRPVYVKYRWGYLRAIIGKPNGNIEDALCGTFIIGVQLGNGMDGNLAWEYVEEQLDRLTENKIKILLYAKGVGNIENIRNKIFKLNNDIDSYCLHKEVSSNGYSPYYGGNISICKRCGKLFISKNTDDLTNS